VWGKHKEMNALWCVGPSLWATLNSKCLGRSPNPLKEIGGGTPNAQYYGGFRPPV